MLDRTHLLYMLISGLIGAVLLTLLFLIKRDRLNRTVILLSSLTVIGLHYSPLWVEFLEKGSATATSIMLFAIYPCHICMWLLLLSALLLKEDGWVARLIKDFTFWGGTVCATIGTVLNENYDKTPSLADYNVLKGLLSHSVLVFGAILLFTSGYVKIRVGRGCAAVAAGLALFLVDGVFINRLFAACGLPVPNAMYLEELPFPSLPWLNTATIGAAALVTVFLVSAVYEELALPREERWHQRLIKRIKK